MTSLIYGDGEFLVAGRTRTGCRMQCDELVTPRLEREMLASLDEEGDDLVRGTDLNLINWEDYAGDDWESFHEIGRDVTMTLRPFPHLEWCDGVMWEDSVRAGKLAPLLRALKGRDVILVGCRQLIDAVSRFLPDARTVAIPNLDAAASRRQTVRKAALVRGSWDDPVYLVCVGLSAIPTILRLRRRVPRASFFDLGSVLDVFAGIGEQRAWRRDLYADRAEWERIKAANLEGVL